MAETIQTCVNHRDTETRIACSSCGDPICTRCMRTAAVGQKCPSCARAPRSARALGKPVHYVRAVGGGLAAAIVVGLVYGQLLGAVRFGSLILAGVAGYAIGRVVKWGARGQAQQPFPAIAGVLAAIAIAAGFVTGIGTLLPLGGGLLILAYPVAVWLALRGMQR